jgi:hypothetical protein
MECEMCTENDKEGKGPGNAVAVKIAEVQSMARHVLRTHWCCGCQGST